MSHAAARVAHILGVLRRQASPTYTHILQFRALHLAQHGDHLHCARRVMHETCRSQQLTQHRLMHTNDADVAFLKKRPARSRYNPNHQGQAKTGKEARPRGAEFKKQENKDHAFSAPQSSSIEDKLLQAILSARELDMVTQLVMENADQLDHVHVCTALVKVASYSKWLSQFGEAKQERLLTGVLSALNSRLVQPSVLTACSARHLANALQSWGKLRVKPRPQVLQLVSDELMRYGNAKLMAAEPIDLSGIMLACAWLKYSYNKELLKAVCEVTRMSCAYRFEAHSLSTFLWAMQRLEVKDQELVNIWEPLIPSMVRDFTLRQCTDVLTMLAARTGGCDPALVQSFGARMVETIDDVQEVKAIVDACVALAACEYNNPDHWLTLVQSACNKGERPFVTLHGGALADFMQAVSKGVAYSGLVGNPEVESFCKLLVQEFMSKKNEVSDINLMRLLLSIPRTRVPQPRLFDYAADRIIPQVKVLRGLDVLRLLRAYNQCGHHHSELFTELFAQLAKKHGPVFLNAIIVAVFDAVQLGQPAGKLGVSLANRLLQEASHHAAPETASRAKGAGQEAGVERDGQTERATGSLAEAEPEDRQAAQAEDKQAPQEGEQSAPEDEQPRAHGQPTTNWTPDNTYFGSMLGKLGHVLAQPPVEKNSAYILRSVLRLANVHTARLSVVDMLRLLMAAKNVDVNIARLCPGLMQAAAASSGSMSSEQLVQLTKLLPKIQGEPDDAVEFPAESSAINEAWHTLCTHAAQRLQATDGQLTISEHIELLQSLGAAGVTYKRLPCRVYVNAIGTSWQEAHVQLTADQLHAVLMCAKSMCCAKSTLRTYLEGAALESAEQLTPEQLGNVVGWFYAIDHMGVPLFKTAAKLAVKKPDLYATQLPLFTKALKRAMTKKDKPNTEQGKDS